MSEVSWRKHALILVALILNLWVGGDYVQLWLGAGARIAFEIILILGYMTLIIGLRTPLPWRRTRSTEEPAADHPPAVDRDHDPTRGL